MSLHYSDPHRPHRHHQRSSNSNSSGESGVMLDHSSGTSLETLSSNSRLLSGDPLRMGQMLQDTVAIILPQQYVNMQSFAPLMQMQSGQAPVYVLQQSMPGVMMAQQSMQHPASFQYNQHMRQPVHFPQATIQEVDANQYLYQPRQQLSAKRQYSQDLMQNNGAPAYHPAPPKPKSYPTAFKPYTAAPPQQQHGLRPLEKPTAAVSSVKTVIVAKALTRSDAHTRRLILPRLAVESNMPEVVGTQSYAFDVVDAQGCEWQFVIRSWPNGSNPKPVYVLEHISEFIKAYSVTAGDVLGLCINRQGRLIVEVNTEEVLAAVKKSSPAKKSSQKRAASGKGSPPAQKARKQQQQQQQQQQQGQGMQQHMRELARTTSEQAKVWDAMEALASFQQAKRVRRSEPQAYEQEDGQEHESEEQTYQEGPEYRDEDEATDSEQAAGDEDDE